VRIELYSYKNRWKFILLAVAVLIALGTLWYTETFLKELRAEEQKRAELWAEATKILATSDDETALLFALQVVEKNTTIPIIQIDSDTTIISTRNIKLPRHDASQYLERELALMMDANEPIVIDLGKGVYQYMFYRDSSTLTQLRIYPIVLLGVHGLFIGVAYMAFSNVRRSEQNRVWTGMAKETAHQIGTPLSSLMGWIEILRSQETDESILKEMEKDIERLLTITDRFSKIGSKPQLQHFNIGELTELSMAYMNKRTSNRIELIYTNKMNTDADVMINRQLYGWVIENLVRNAIDAIEGKGKIEVVVDDTANNVLVDVHDTGKGIATGRTKAIFRPGYTTKTRGWGLGLSLAKRIIEEYHNGKIGVLKSSPGKGTTFRIILPKAR
jgi:signal transduction histidine kinase